MTPAELKERRTAAEKVIVDFGTACDGEGRAWALAAASELELLDEVDRLNIQLADRIEKVVSACETASRHVLESDRLRTQVSALVTAAWALHEALTREHANDTLRRDGVVLNNALGMALRHFKEPK